MIVILSGRERHTRGDLFDRYFQCHYRVFVRGKGWQVASVNGREVDSYDDDDAIYFLDLDGPKVVASLRITPTVKSSLIADHLPQLIENSIPARAPSIYECNRLVMPRSGDNRYAKSSLLGTMLEWCFAQRLTHLHMLIDAEALPEYLELTPLTTPLGLPQFFGGGPKAPTGGACMAVRWPICPQLLDDVRRYGQTESNNHLHDGAVTPKISSDRIH
jgi:acyl-homoserine lactone synthase